MFDTASMIRSPQTISIPGFFDLLGRLSASRHPEDQLSNTFATCFNYSAAFRGAIGSIFTTHLKLKPLAPDLRDWSCRTQISQSDSRYDIHLTPPKHAPKNQNLIIIENKCDAPLTEKQLLKYSKKPEHSVIAITKNYPEVSRGFMQSYRILSLRWQDLYRHLSAITCHDRVDRFLINRFLGYLEGADMAFNEVSVGELKDLRALLQGIRKQKRDGMVRKASFRTGDHVLELLKEAYYELQEYLTHSGNWKFWGPGYDYYDEEHHLSFCLWKRTQREHLSINCGFALPEDIKEDVYYYTYFWDEKINRYHKRPHYFQSVDNLCDKDGKLDKGKLVKAALSRWKMWGIAAKP